MRFQQIAKKRKQFPKFRRVNNCPFKEWVHNIYRRINMNVCVHEELEISEFWRAGNLLTNHNEYNNKRKPKRVEIEETVYLLEQWCRITRKLFENNWNSSYKRNNWNVGRLSNKTMGHKQYSPWHSKCFTYKYNFLIISQIFDDTLNEGKKVVTYRWKNKFSLGQEFDVNFFKSWTFLIFSFITCPHPKNRYNLIGWIFAIRANFVCSCNCP